jgi:hypothetical protein
MLTCRLKCEFVMTHVSLIWVWCLWFTIGWKSWIIPTYLPSLCPPPSAFLLRTWCQGWHRWCLYSFKQCNITIWLSCWEHKWDYYDVIDLEVDVQDVVLKLLVSCNFAGLCFFTPSWHLVFSPFSSYEQEDKTIFSLASLRHCE